jgi:hypothetical protein
MCALVSHRAADLAISAYSIRAAVALMPSTRRRQTQPDDNGVRTLYRYVSYPALVDQVPSAIELRRRADALVTSREFATVLSLKPVRKAERTSGVTNLRSL